MSQVLFEQYKEALRRGHAAVAQGHLEAAVRAYEAAATLAPDRVLPHTSLADVLHRLGRHDASERAYGDALQRSAGDETALRGRAALRLELRRPLDAARDLEALAEALEDAGRLPEASNAVCDALDIAESRVRRRIVERLAKELRSLDGDPKAAEALARAAPYLETAAEPGDQESGSESEPSTEVAAPPPFDPVARRLEAETLMASGSTREARPLLLAIAAAERTAGHLDAALDACLILMTVEPADSALQLEIAANHAARGWSDLAREKLALLARIAELDSNAEVVASIRAFADDHGIDLSRAALNEAPRPAS